MTEFWSGFAVGGFVFFWVGVIVISPWAIKGRGKRGEVRGKKGGNEGEGEFKRGGVNLPPSTPRPNVKPKSMRA